MIEGLPYTAGPWSFGHAGIDGLWVGPSHAQPPVAIVPHDTHPEARDNSRDNARILAAAPLMLDALVEAAGTLQGAATCMRLIGAHETADMLIEASLTAMAAINAATIGSPIRARL